MSAWLSLLLGGYLLGAVPFGLLVCRAMTGVDPRTDGSRNIGATNVARIAGKQAGVATLVLDVAKGFLPTALALAWLPDWQAATVGLASFSGHVWPIYLRFHGGKGVATAIGVLLGFSPLALCGVVVVLVLAVWLTGYMSVGSMLGCGTSPLWLMLTGQSFSLVLASLFMAIIVAWRHRENISRLSLGQENRLR